MQSGMKLLCTFRQLSSTAPPFARIDSKIDSLILLSLTDWKAGGSLRPLFSHLLEVL
jgi:hypothetical protein